KLWIISAEVAGLINNQYAAGCLHVGAEGVFGGGVQGRYRFSDGNISGGLFGNDNCSDQLKQYSQKPLVKHSGGFVTEESARFPSRIGHRFDVPANRLGGTFEAARSVAGAAAATSESFTLPGATMGQELRITTATGTPVVAIRGPGGEIYETPPTAGHLVTVPGKFMSAVGPHPGEVLVLLRHPRGGEWRVQAIAGSPPVAHLETAEDLPPASVNVHLRHARPRHRGHGGAWTLAYRIAHFVPGTKVRFVERGKDSTHVLGTVSSARGTLRFAPAEALSRSRTVLAYLLNAEGAIVRELTVGHYSAPAAFRPRRPRGVRITRHGLTALLTWAAVPGATGYRVKVRGSDGRLETHVLKAGQRRVAIPRALGFESFNATVTAVGGRARLKGGTTTARLKPVRAVRRAHHRRKH
ncbi:MAG: hypothetical protein KGJ43_07240, partial [Acidobacteriota bacterium]|nr:hypothetical protein [Acidobacteriota bacterium]